jgi:hypothetical protein
VAGFAEWRRSDLFNDSDALGMPAGYEWSGCDGNRDRADGTQASSMVMP